MKNIIQWAEEFNPLTKPWLLLGKGPSFQRISDVPVDEFHTFALNHAVSQLPVTISHICDVHNIYDYPDDIYNNAQYLLMPYRPHIKMEPTDKTIFDLVKESPLLGKMDKEDRLVYYNLSTSEPYDSSPTIYAQAFSSEAALNIFVAWGVPVVKSLGIDGGRGYMSGFDGLVGSDSKNSNFSHQFINMARTMRRSGIDYAPWYVDSPIKVFIGIDKDAPVLAAKVLDFSIKKHTSMATSIKVINKKDWKTVPKLCSNEGRAIYIDANILMYQDLFTIWTLPLESCAVSSKDNAILLFDCSKELKESEIVEKIPLTESSDLTQESRIVRFNQHQPWQSNKHPYRKIWYDLLQESLSLGYVPKDVIDTFPKGLSQWLIENTFL